jgi:hypothetical protein
MNELHEQNPCWEGELGKKLLHLMESHKRRDRRGSAPKSRPEVGCPDWGLS